MTIELRTPAEAFAAVAWLVCGADKSGSTQEREFLYEQVRSLDVFENCTLIDFQNLLGATFNKLFHDRPNGELAIPAPDVKTAIQAVHNVLTPALRADAFRMAVGLASIDNLCDVETSLLEQLRAGLDIDDEVTAGLLRQEQGAKNENSKISL